MRKHHTGTAAKLFCACFEARYRSHLSMTKVVLSFFKKGRHPEVPGAAGLEG
jgi:hypothetical protein